MPLSTRDSRGARLRRPLARALPLLAALAALAAPPAAAQVAPAPPPAAFWDAYVSARAASARQPDSLAAVAAARLARDPDDFLGAWLRGHCASAVRDSVAAIAEIADSAAAPGAGPRLSRAALELRRGRRAEAAIAFASAETLYATAGRDADAARAALFRAQYATPARDSTGQQSALARAEALARRAGDPAALADVLLALASEDYDDAPSGARPRREEAVRLLEPLGPSYQLASAHRGLGNVLKFAGELDAAERHFRASLASAEAIGSRIQRARALGGLGNVQRALGDFDAALESYRQALAEARASAPARTVIARHGDLGLLYLSLGRLAEAREQLERASAIAARGLGDADQRVSLLDSRASLEAMSGRFDAARAALDSAIALARRLSLPARLPFLYLRHAEIAHNLGDVVESTRYADLGLAAAQAAAHRRAEVALRSLRAELLLTAGQPALALAEARAFGRAALAWEPRQQGAAARVEAFALDALGRRSEALALLDREVARTAHSPDSSGHARSLVMRGELLLRHGRPVAAEADFRRAWRTYLTLGDSVNAAVAVQGIGEARLGRGRPLEAVRWLRDAVAFRERIASALGTSDERSGYRAGGYDGAVALVAALARSGDAQGALEQLERSRARELRRILSSAAPGLRGRVAGPLAAALEAAERELGGVQASLLAELQRPARERGRSVNALERRADSLKAQRQDLVRRIELELPGYGTASGLSERRSRAALRATLRPNEQVVACMTGSYRTVIVRFGRDHIATRVLPIGEAYWARRIEALNRRLRAGAARAEAVAGLGDTLLSGGPPLGGDAVLYVVADGPLLGLPFEALGVAAPGGEARALIDEAEVVYAASTRVLLEPEPGRTPRTDAATLVAFGDPARPGTATARGDDGAGADSTPDRAYPRAGRLAHARREVEAIRDAFPSARVYLAERASEAAFLSEAGRASILHVAAHGFLDDRHPAYSGLVLAPDSAGTGGPTDGLVQAFEISETPMRLELATLSACESGGGGLRRGEGLLGLVRAFQVAGARSVVASLWRIEDASAADLMVDFYRRLAAGARPSLALRESKRAMMRQGVPAPGGGDRGVGVRPRPGAPAGAATWASFVLVGARVAP
jgi:CHAT domain-containing protein